MSLPSVRQAHHFVACTAVSPIPRIYHRHEPSFLLRPAARPTLILLLLHPSPPLHDLSFVQHVRLSRPIDDATRCYPREVVGGGGGSGSGRVCMWTYEARVEIHSVIYRINGSLARFLSHKSKSSSLFSFLSIHPSYISFHFHNRLPTHPSPPSTPQTHVSIFLTCIHRVRSDHSYKSQVLASLPSSAPDLTQRAGRPVSFAKPVHCDSRSPTYPRSPARARLQLCTYYPRIMLLCLASRPRVHHQHRGHQLINSSRTIRRCALHMARVRVCSLRLLFVRGPISTRARAAALGMII